MSIGFNQKFQHSQAHKVERFLQTYGEYITFLRPALNEFGEPDRSQVLSPYQILGVYHEEVPHMYKAETTSDASTQRLKPSPMVLMKVSDAELVQLHDLVCYHEQYYKVIGKADVAERGFAINVSIEEVQSNGDWVSA